MSTDNQKPDALLLVEKEDGAERFMIRSDQLEHIGSKLRGFSIFNSIFLPFMVSVVTVFFTGLFQYISWINEVRLREATDVATRAMGTTVKIATAINQRRYTTLTYFDPLHELVREHSNEIARREAVAELERGDTMVGQPPPSSPRQQTRLAAYEEERGKGRFKAYYEQLTEWNETAGQLVTDLDYALDRPIFIRARGTAPSEHRGINDYYALKDINCASSSLPDELRKKQLDPRRLKLRLVGIHYCFMQLNALLADKKSAINGQGWDKAFSDDLIKRLNYIDHMGNELRCYALHRVDYFNSLKEESIISPQFVWNKLFGGGKERAEKQAEKQFEQAAAHCDPEQRKAALRARTVASAK